MEPPDVRCSRLIGAARPRWSKEHPGQCGAELEGVFLATALSMSSVSIAFTRFEGESLMAARTHFAWSFRT